MVTRTLVQAYTKLSLKRGKTRWLSLEPRSHKKTYRGLRKRIEREINNGIKSKLSCSRRIRSVWMRSNDEKREKQLNVRRYLETRKNLINNRQNASLKSMKPSNAKFSNQSLSRRNVLIIVSN